MSKVYTLGPMHLCREYFKAKVYTISAHGPLGYVCSGRTSVWKDRGLGFRGLGFKLGV